MRPMAAQATATETRMFIPSYQIHNILKDFTLQLKRMRQVRSPEAGKTAVAPTPKMGPDQLRLASVAAKVADDIMLRIANLGREDEGTPPVMAERPARVADEGGKTNPAVFDYHLMDCNRGKVKKRLVVEDSHNLVERFQHLTAAGEKTGNDQA